MPKKGTEMTKKLARQERPTILRVIDTGRTRKMIHDRGLF